MSRRVACLELSLPDAPRALSPASTTRRASWLSCQGAPRVCKDGSSHATRVGPVPDSLRAFLGPSHLAPRHPASFSRRGRTCGARLGPATRFIVCAPHPAAPLAWSNILCLDSPRSAMPSSKTRCACRVLGHLSKRAARLAPFSRRPARRCRWLGAPRGWGKQRHGAPRFV